MYLGKTVTSKISRDKMFLDKVSLDKISQDKMSLDKIAPGKTLPEKMSLGTMFMDKISLKKLSQDKMSPFANFLTCCAGTFYLDPPPPQITRRSLGRTVRVFMTSAEFCNHSPNHHARLSKPASGGHRSTSIPRSEVTHISYLVCVHSGTTRIVCAELHSAGTVAR